MATSLFSRSLLSRPFTVKTPTLTTFISRTFKTSPSTKTLTPYNHRFTLRPLAASVGNFSGLAAVNTSLRSFSTRPTSSSLNDPNPNWSNRPPKETILLDGCDFEHWLVVVEPPQGEPTRDEIIDNYIKTLAKVVGSEDEAKMKIYSVSTRCYFAFGALVSEELSYKLKEIPGVRWVLPDSYLDVRNKDYGGEPFINGQAVPYDPKYHAEWIRNNQRANERNRRNDRPRNFDRSRNFERRRENTGPPQGNMNGGAPPPQILGGMPPPNMAGAPPPQYNMGGMPPQNNMGGILPPQNNMGGMPPHQNIGGMPPPQNMGGMPPQNMGGMPPPQNNMGGMPPHQNMGGMPPPQNMGGMPPPQNNMGGMLPQNIMNNMPPHNMGQMPPQQNMGQMPQQNNMGQMPARNMGSPNGGWSGNNNPGNMQNYQNSGPNPGSAPYQGGAPNDQYQSFNPNRDGNAYQA